MTPTCANGERWRYLKPSVEREALSLIHRLRDQRPAPSEWLDAIAANQSLAEPVRQRALQFARDWK